MYSYEEFISKININYDNWDDFGHKTTAILSIDGDVAAFNINPNNIEVYKKICTGRKPMVDDFFVLGNQEYYELINSKIKTQTDREKWYRLTNDLAFDTEIFDEYVSYYDSSQDVDIVTPNDIIRTSFMRSKNYLEVVSQLHRMTQGAKYLDSYKFSISPIGEKNVVFDIDIDPSADIPANTYGMIGKNGSGKSFYLYNLAKLFLNEKSIFEIIEEDSTNNYFTMKRRFNNPNGLSKVIYVSFSPFDDFTKEIQNKDKFEKIGFAQSDVEHTVPYLEFNNEILDSIGELYVKSNDSLKDFWNQILSSFEYEEWIARFLDNLNEQYIKNNESLDIKNDDIDRNFLFDLIEKLSSGQKIIILTLSNLILKVRERSLVLIDEPELFLHPSLIKSYTRAIIEIITKMNGICVIATHNSLVLQELQTKCVRITEKKGADNYYIYNLSDMGLQSYGENVSVLNNTVFGIDIQNTGYYQYLTSAKKSQLLHNFDKLNDSLGSEGRVLLNYLVGEDYEEN